MSAPDLSPFPSRRSRRTRGTGRLVTISFLSLATLSNMRANPINLSTLQLVGTAQLVSGNVLRLTDTTDPTLNSGGPAPAGAAWTTTRFDVADPFSISFDFQMSDFKGNIDNDGSGGDGIAFVIQNSDAGSNALGVGSGGIGFLGIKDSVAVMLDAYKNNFYYGDPSGHYVGVNTRGTEANYPHHFCRDNKLTSDPSQGTDVPDVFCTSDPSLGLSGPIAFDDGKVHTASLLYNPGTLNVYVDSMLALSVALNLADTLSLANGTGAYLGFTSGTRGSYQNNDVLDFAYTPVPEPATGAACFVALSILAAIASKRKKMEGR